MKYNVSLNGKFPPLPGIDRAVDEVTMKCAVMDIILALVEGDPAAYTKVTYQVRPVTTIMVFHHSGVDVISTAEAGHD